MIMHYLKSLLHKLEHFFHWLNDFQLKTKFPWDFAQLQGVSLFSALWYADGSILPVLIILQVVNYLAVTDPWLVIKMSVNTVTVQTVIASFVFGFGAAVAYINHKLKEKKCSLTEIMALNFNSFNGNWKRAAGVALLVFLLVALPGAWAVEHLSMYFMHVKELADPAVAFLNQLQGFNRDAFITLATVGAPIFEEIVFRGFLLNALLITFRHKWFRKYIFKNELVAQYAAAIVSGFIFASAHMSPQGFFVLWFLGTVLGLTYLRTGSLYCPMMIHLLNNATATVPFLLKH